MTQWEYKIVGAGLKPVGLHAREEQINELGRQGWELVAVGGQLLYFERPLSITQKSPGL